MEHGAGASVAKILWRFEEKSPSILRREAGDSAIPDRRRPSLFQQPGRAVCVIRPMAAQSRQVGRAEKAIQHFSCNGGDENVGRIRHGRVNAVAGMGAFCGQGITPPEVEGKLTS